MRRKIIGPGKLLFLKLRNSNFVTVNRTHYGFIYHDGPFLYANIDSSLDVIVSTHVTFTSKNQYDQVSCFRPALSLVLRSSDCVQAGLMIRISPDCWLKTSIEYEGPSEPSRLGAVVTNNGFSGMF